MRQHRWLRLVLGLAVLAMLGVTLAAWADCRYCSKSDPNGGECDIVLTPNPSILTLSNCVGTLRCRIALNEEICFPHCEGDPCFWT